MTRAGHVSTLAVLALAAVSAAFPAFLIGALSVQIRAEFDISASVLGWSIAGYFLAAALSSTWVGGLAQRIGPRRQLVAALATAASADLLLAAFARSYVAVLALLAVAGVANAAAQTSVNLAITQAGLPRLGLALALKQSGMPAASMLSGLAVPVIALTVGWRWAFAAGGLVAALAASLALVVVRSAPAATADASVDDRPPAARSTTRALIGAAVASGFLAFGAGALNAWLVESGVDAGLSNGTAGLMLSGGAALGIVVRVGWGVRLDTLDHLPFRIAGLMAFAGAAGMALLAVRVAPVHVAATVVAFAGGWIWPVFTNFGVVRANSGHAAAATGITQTGVYAGVLAAPLVTGLLIDHAGYPAMWLTVAAAMVVGATVALRVAHHF